MEHFVHHRNSLVVKLAIAVSLTPTKHLWQTRSLGGSKIGAPNQVRAFRYRIGKLGVLNGVKWIIRSNKSGQTDRPPWCSFVRKSHKPHPTAAGRLPLTLDGSVIFYRKFLSSKRNVLGLEYFQTVRLGVGTLLCCWGVPLSYRWAKYGTQTRTRFR